MVHYNNVYMPPILIKKLQLEIEEHTAHMFSLPYRVVDTWVLGEAWEGSKL